MLAASRARTPQKMITVTRAKARLFCRMVFTRLSPGGNGVVEAAAREQVVGRGAVDELDVDGNEPAAGRGGAGFSRKNRKEVAGCIWSIRRRNRPAACPQRQ